MSDSNVNVKMRVKTLNKMKSEQPMTSNLPDDKKTAPSFMRVKSFDKQMSEDEHQRRTYSDEKMAAPFSMKLKSFDQQMSDDEHQRRTYSDDKMAAPFSMRVKPLDKKMSKDEHQPRTYSDDKMMGGPSMESPMPFITTDANGKLYVNSDVMQVLSQAKQPVSIVSVVGKYRTGKSYILNRFFNENAGFSLGGTIQSKTKGIWIWARPHPLDRKRTLLLLDTEGLHDVEKGDATHDMQLFSLSLLLSNCLVYNATGTLDDTIIQQLHLVTNLTERIKIKKESEEELGNDFSKYFPTFFLLLRDFFLELDLHGHACSADEYMENALKMKEGSGKKVNDYNLPRECIRLYFPTRKCHTLCKPVDDDAKLRHLDEVPEGGIKKEFLSAAKKAIDDILKEAKPFTVDGNLINGPRFIDLASTYVDAMNNGGIPCISSAMDLLKNNECQRALEEALSIFSDVMDNILKDQLPVKQDSMSTAQESAHAAAMNHYNENSLLDKTGKFMAILAKELDHIYQVYIEQNNTMSRKKCNELLKKCFQALDGNIHSGKYMNIGGYKMYKTDKEKALKDYKEAAKNILLAEDTLDLFLEARKIEEIAIINADKALTEKEKQRAIEKEERMRQEERAKAAESEKERLEADNLRKREENAEMIKQFKQDMDKRNKEMHEEHAYAMEKQKSEYDRMLRQGEEKQAEQLKAQISENKKVHEQERSEHKSYLVAGLDHVAHWAESGIGLVGKGLGAIGKGIAGWFS